MTSITDRYAIVGVGESERSKSSGKSPLRMAVEASRNAMNEAGLGAADIDCILSYQHSDSCDGHSLGTHLGIRPTFYMDTFGGGSSTEMLVATAIGLIEAGICNTALIYRSMNGRSGKRMGMGDENPWDLHGIMEMLIPGGSFVVPYGITTPAQQFAMVANRHMWETGTTSEHLGHVCMTFYEHASRNPNALLHGKTLTMEEYLASPFIVTPFRLHDCCVETDEANAIIVTSAERAQDCATTPIYVMGVSARNSVPHANQYAMRDITEVGGFYAAPQVFAMAGITPKDVHVGAIYDCFSWVVLAQLEAYGFVGRGEGGPFAAEGNLGLGGTLPSNTAGGMSAEGYTHGMNNVLELVRQLRHDYQGEPRQVEGCEIGIATGWDGPHAASAMIVRR
jgi:acetyl-CoA acetyltransferase